MAMGKKEASYESFISMVHCLIEHCIVFGMNMEQCMETLDKYAGVQPAVTSVVWKQLELDNKEFFDQLYKQMRTKNEAKAAAAASTDPNQREMRTA